MRRFKISMSTMGMTLAVMLGASACSSSTSTTTTSAGGSGFQGVSLTGAGATFPDPIYEQWFKDFQGVEPGAKINYQAIGSGGGVKNFTEKTIDAAIDKLAHAIAEGDAPKTVEEIDTNAEVVGTIDTPNVTSGADTKPAVFTLGVD